MNPDPEISSPVPAKIQELEAKLAKLEQQIAIIGQPAGHELQRRVEALKIEENALKRNFEESRKRGEPDSVRLAKIDALLAHIEREEASVEHDADFLNQAAPSSMGLAVQAGATIVDLARRGVKAVIGDHHPLGSSAFVNHTHDDLADEYGLDDGQHAPPPAKEKDA